MSSTQQKVSLHEIEAKEFMEKRKSENFFIALKFRFITAKRNFNHEGNRPREGKA
jgi:hypothetical protein